MIASYLRAEQKKNKLQSDKFQNICFCFCFFSWKSLQKQNTWFELPQPPESRGASYTWPKRSPTCRTQSTTAYSLFWKKQNNRNCKGTEKKGNTGVLSPHQNLKLVLSVFSLLYWIIYKKNRRPLHKGGFVLESCLKNNLLIYTGNVLLPFTAC